MVDCNQLQIKQTNEVLSCEHRITQFEIISALMKYMYMLSLFTRQSIIKKIVWLYLF